MKWSLVVVMALAAAPAHAYGVGRAQKLGPLTAKAEIACKGVVLGDTIVKDPWFGEAAGFSVHETELQVIGCVKGAVKGTLKFRHYAEGPPAPSMFTPPHVELAKGRAYVVWGVKEAGGAYRIVDKWPSVKIDADALLAADAQPYAAGTKIEDAVWHELRGLVMSADPADVKEGVKQLDEHSGGALIQLEDFGRPAALAEIAAALASSDASVVSAAVDVFGGDSPIYKDEDAGYWLAGLPGASIEGLSARKIAGEQGAKAAVRPLVGVADNAKLPADVRARAIRAVGRVVDPAKLGGWLRDPDARVRAAVVLASAERPDRTVLQNALRDPNEQVRAAAALGVGFSRDAKLLPALVPLLKDPGHRVHENAAMSVLSFPVDVAKPTLVAGLATDYRSLFVNALAKADVVPYLKQLEDVIAKQEQPADWWGGRVPAADSWSLVFAYEVKRPAAELAGGKHDAELDALEKMKWFSSGEPRDLYALYVSRKLAARAAKFRASFAGSPLVDAQYLDQADHHPEQFVAPAP